MGYKNNDKCLDKAFEDEEIFVLMARDVTAPTIVMEWITRNLHTQPPEKLREAFEHALKMVQNQSYFRSLASKRHIDDLHKKP